MKTFRNKILLTITLHFVWALHPQQNDSLPYAHPSEVGLDSVYIHSQADSIITNGIKEGAFPGAQVLAAKNGQIIFHKAYGFHTYDSVQAVSPNDVYDLASVTKTSYETPRSARPLD